MCAKKKSDLKFKFLILLHKFNLKFLELLFFLKYIKPASC